MLSERKNRKSLPLDDTINIQLEKMFSEQNSTVFIYIHTMGSHTPELVF